MEKNIRYSLFPRQKLFLFKITGIQFSVLTQLFNYLKIIHKWGGCEWEYL